MREIKSGEIYLCQLDGIGSEQKGIRPVLISSCLDACVNSPNIQIIPLTSKISKKNYLPTHFMLNKEEYDFLTYNSITLGENVTTIDKTRLENRLGVISELHLRQIVANMQKTFY